MSSTNKTQNYNLSQYIGSDKPTYLGDYNADMLAIDTQMKLNENNIEVAKTTADTAQERADEGYTLAETANGTAETANGTATTALENSLTNQAKISKLNISGDVLTYSGLDMNINNGNIRQYSNIKIQCNSDKSIIKISGRLWVAVATAGEFTVTIPATPLRPTNQIKFDSVLITMYNNNLTTGDITINPNGDINFSCYSDKVNNDSRVNALPFELKLNVL